MSKRPLYKFTFVSCCCLLGKQIDWKTGHRWTRTVRALPWVQEGLLPNACLPQTTGMCLSDHEQLCFSCLEPGIRLQHREGRTPLSISMRACHDEHLAYDGPLTVSVCHLHVIPASAHIPDLGFLFEHPRRGRQILQGILDEVDAVCLEQCRSSGRRPWATRRQT